jgi:putative SOS response-associated peptidase YedK
MEWVFSIVTRDANEDMKAIHPRMPLMLGADEISSWLSQETQLPKLEALLRADIGRLNIVQT